MIEIYQYWLASTPGISGRKKCNLLNLFGTEEEIYKQSEEALKKSQKLSQEEIEILINSKKQKELARDFDVFRKKDIKLICYGDEEYPEKLKHIYDAPYCLFVKGELPGPEEKMVAVVGARNCSSYGQVVAENIGKYLAQKGMGIISGMAYGIDTWAHRGTLEGNGNTYAVLGCGVDICYPATNRKMYEQIPQKGGIISEYACGAPPLQQFFPQRNRIISALSDVVIVVEAKKRSGSLITADYALEQGKVVYAVPGRINDSLSYGTNWLLSQGAAPFYSIDEFLKDIGEFSQKTMEKEKLIENSLEKNERLVYSVLDLTPKCLEIILNETGLGLGETVKVLQSLIEYGCVKETYKNYYIKASL